MFFRNILPALVGLSLAAAVPTSVERDAAGVLHRRPGNDKRDVIIQQTVIEPQVIVINQNLGALNALALQAEQELAALVQSQLLLVSTVETIKNNIRVNHFKTRWDTVNTVIVVVTKVVDARDPANVNNRFMVNQLKADSNNPAQEIIVMMTAADMTLQPAATGTPANLNSSGVAGAGQAISQPTSQPQVAQLDPATAFAQAAGGAVLLPFDSTAPAPPSGAQLFPDPASIILPNQNLFVGDVGLIQQDAALLAAAGSLFNLQSQLLAQQAIAQAELAGVLLGTAPPPTTVIISRVNSSSFGNGARSQSSPTR